MVPCIVVTLLLIVLGAIALDIFLPVIGIPIAIFIVLYILFFSICSYRHAEVMPAAEAAETMFRRNSNKTPDLPDKFRGVWWFSDNAAPELLMTMDGAEFDAETRSIVVKSGAPENWTYSTGLVGWAYWAVLRMSYFWRSKLYLNFNEDYTHADMPLYMMWCIPVPMGMFWDMTQIDDDTWDRGIYLYCSPFSRWPTGSYTLRRIIDKDGNKLPAFEEMVKSVEEGWKIKGFAKKPEMQIVNETPRGCLGYYDQGDYERMGEA